MSGRLKGKVAFITGGTSGIGRGIVERFAAEGAQVAFIGRNAENGAAVEKSVRDAGGDALYVQADIGVESDIRRAVEKTVARFGKLTALINNAAGTELGTTDGRIGDVDLAAWEQLQRVNLTGTFLSTKYAINAMVKSGGGTIVNISSIASITGLPGSIAYTAAKGAINSMTRSIAVDYANAGIRCNCLVLGLHPGDRWSFFLTDPAFRDPMQAVHLTPRFGIPDDVAYACIYLSSEESGFVTGSQLLIDGGAHSATRYPTQQVNASYSDYDDKQP